MAKKKAAKKVSSQKSSQTKKSDTISFKKPKVALPRNFWMIAAIVLAILLIVNLNNGGSSGASISTETAGQKVIDFAAAQGATASVVSVKESGTLYEVTISIEGQNVPVYVTKDGKNLIPSLIPLNEEGAAAAAGETAPTTNTPTPNNIPTSDKPSVELFVMSICPYGTQMEKGLLPVLDALGDKIDFELKFVYYAMHDKEEVDENTVQYCVQKEYGRQKLQEYLYCYLQEYDTEVWNSCITTLGMDQDTIDECVASADSEFGITAAFEDQASWLSGRFPIYPVHYQENQDKGVGGSPTLIINGVEAQVPRDPATLLATVCAAFENAPAECDTDLSSQAYNPGFGFSTAPTSASAAACGAY